MIYLALAAKAHGHEDHKFAQIDTWAGNLEQDSRVIWIYGDPNLKQGKLVGDDLFLPVEEKYENILIKSILGVNWVLTNLEFDYLVRTNTSNYFLDHLVRRQLNKMHPNELVFSGVKAKWKGTVKDRKWFHKYISGSGIYMTRKSAEILSSIPLSEYLGVPDDVAIGHFLYSKGAKTHSIKRNNLTDFKPLWLMPQIRVKSWKNDQVTADRMKEVHAIFFAGNSANLKKSLRAFIQHEVRRASIEKPRRKWVLKYQYIVISPTFYQILKSTLRYPR